MIDDMSLMLINHTCKYKVIHINKLVNLVYLNMISISIDVNGCLVAWFYIAKCWKSENDESWTKH